MLKKILITTTLGLGICQASIADDELNLAGKYECSGYDSHDGSYDNVILTLTLDSQNSDDEHNFAAYGFELAEADGTVQYTGEAAASGNSLAIYFKNTDPEKQTDSGVGIATVSHDLNANGKASTVIHKFYYEPTYQGGGNGSETCVKKR
jgi:hypothetical protein